jgi:hypothetical protein
MLTVIDNGSMVRYKLRLSQLDDVILDKADQAGQVQRGSLVEEQSTLLNGNRPHNS